MKTYLTYGAGITAAGAVLTLVLHIMGYWTNPERLGTALMIASIGGLAISTVGIVLGTKAVRDPVGPAGFTYGQAFKAGLFIILASAAFGLVFNFVYFKFINPNFAETTIQWTQSLMERMGAPEAQIEKKIDEMRQTTTVTRQLINGAVGAICFGAVISLITAAILKRAPKEDLSEPPPIAS
jgi:hypothetical protein